MIIVDLLYNLAILIALSTLSGFIRLRFDKKAMLNKTLQGLLFGLVAITGMINPFVLEQGFIIDGRTIVISLCALFFGPISGIISTLMTVAYRFHIGGIGATMGTLTTVSAFLIGLFFYYRKQKLPDQKISILKLYVLGILVHIAMLLFVLSLPSKSISGAYEKLTLTVLIVFPIVTIVIGKILSDQEQNLKYVEKLSESEENYRLLIENQTDLVIKIDNDGVLKFVSPSYCRLIGRSQDELLDKSFIPLVYEDDVELINSSMPDLLKEPYINFAEVRVYTRLGLRWIAWSNTALFDKERNIRFIVGVGRDITEMKIAQQELQFSEEKFYKAFKSSPDSLSLTELQSGKIIEANDGFERVFGYPVKDIIGKYTLELKVWANEEDRANVVAKLKSEGRVQDYEAIGKRKNDELFVGLVSAEIIHIADQPYMLSFVKDITKSKQAEENLKKNEEKYRMLIEMASDAFFQGDTMGNLITINDKAIELSGYTKDELLTKNLAELFAPDSLEKNPLVYERLDSGETFRTEREVIKKNGERVFIEMNSRKMPDGTYQSFIRDITERKKLIKDLIEAKEKAEEMNRIKTFFFANMSHELRTPFVGIQGYSELLSESLKDPEEREMAEQILKASKRLTDTLNKILNVTRLEFDKLELNITKVDVTELILSLAKLYEKSAKINHTILKVNCSSNPIIINSDAKLLEEIISNLINNAVKYTHEGSIEIICNIENKDNNDTLIIKVADTGVGIPKEKQEIIWQEFRQASEGYNRSFEGTGLGLTIIKKYVTALKGEISLSSEVGIGSIFTIKLPVTLSAKIDNAKKKSESSNQAPVLITETNKSSILFVEDDKIALSYIDKVLNKLYKVTTAFSASEALELVNKFTYDILLLDINLGKGLDGVELMKMIREIPAYKNTPIVAVTAYAAASDKQEFLAKGFSHYISKPFSSEQLKNLLQDIVQQANN